MAYNQSLSDLMVAIERWQATKEAASQGSQQRSLAVLGSEPQQQKHPQGASVVVIGDAMIDRYWLAADPTSISAEAPIPVCKIKSIVQCQGGAANVAANLTAQKVDCTLIHTTTPIKNRLMAGDVQIARFDENDYCLAASEEQLKPLTTAEVIVVADYNKGTISIDALEVIYKAYLRGAKVFIDTKKDPEVYGLRSATYFPNQREWEQYRSSYALLPNVVKKEGAQGMTIKQAAKLSSHYPSLAKKVVCVNGAGDTVIASWIAAQLSGVDAGWWASVAAAIAVESPLTSCPSAEMIAARYGEECRLRLGMPRL